MAAHRRDFLKLTGGALLAWGAGGPAAAGAPRGYLRVRRRSVAEAVRCLGQVFDGAQPEAQYDATLRYRDFVACYEPGPRQLVICGHEATLVFDSSGVRRFA